MDIVVYGRDGTALTDMIRDTAAIAAHELCPKASLVWFAEDAAFGAQSYRVDCRYFTAEPVNGAVVAEAIRHCCSVSGYADTEFQEVEV